MAGITLQQAEAQLDAWMAASAAVTKGQSYAIAGRSVTRADAAEIRKNIEYWDRKCKQLEASAGSSGGARVRSGVLIP